MPFAQTGLISSRGTARQGSMGENYNHYTGVRLRVIGSGDLRMTFLGQDEIQTESLTPFTLASADRKSPFRLTNFISQRVHFKVETTAIDETFTIHRIVIFAKQIYTEEPG